MPDKPLTIATYAAGASLAAITLVYVFGPTFFLDDSSNSSRKKASVVGLSNPANDCFINAVLQVLAGLPDLRKYLIREVHRRQLGGAEVYAVTEAEAQEVQEQNGRVWMLEGLRQGLVTQALKEVLDKLNERPIYRKTISAQGFVAALEQAFRTRISRQQQDAQEFLQIVTERLQEEYHAGRKARRKHRRMTGLRSDVSAWMVDMKPEERGRVLGQSEQDTEAGATDGDAQEDDQGEDEEKDGFPFEGKIESQIECLTCSFKPKPTVSTFVTLTLNVPQTSSTSLNSCFDGMLKVEHIDDFKCAKCRLQHAEEVKHRELLNATASTRPKTRDSPDEHPRPLPGNIRTLTAELAQITKALMEDPEKPPKDVTLPEAPKQRIARHMRISSFPKVLGIHLSRSIYSASSLSTKNMAKVAFPESLALGGILDRKQYRLLGVVTHKGGHNSGHYESFRRQIPPPAPYSTPHSFGAEGAYSGVGTPSLSVVPSPRIPARDSQERPGEHGSMGPPSVVPSPSLLSPSPSMSSGSSRSSREERNGKPPTSHPRDEGSLRPPASSSSSQQQPRQSTSAASSSMADVAKFKRKVKRKKDDRWWRISDDRIKECRTTEVLGMQKEVYLLFYELDVEGEEQ